MKVYQEKGCLTIRKLLRGLSIIVFIVCAGILVKLLLIDPYFLNKSNEEVKNIYHTDGISLEDRFKSLLEINSDIKGWLFISETRIDYPVLQSENDPTFYLTHDYKKETSRYGSIFIDSSCKLGTNSKNIIIHGHHMRDGQMFADLMKFSDLEFYKQNPIIEFDSVVEKADWKIISIFKTNTLPEQGTIFNYIIPSFGSSQDFLNFVNQVRIRSLIDTPVDVNENDQLITLSTCSYEFTDFRTVVVARKVREGESRVVDTSSAKKASNPLMPKCWYDRYGGTPPV